MKKYEMTIGIECHVQLATQTKLFSRADNDARDKDPNSVVSHIDYGLPGMLPLLNRRAVELAVKAGKALNAPIARSSRFDRKHYFYPDLPKGYQITQMYQPIILSGFVKAPLDNGETKTVRIHHAHLEEDAGKLSHFTDYSLVDLNRAGTPLIEIVSEPDMHSPKEAKAYASELYRLMTFSGVTYGDLYHGNMRFDVNISVAERGSTELGNRAEVKNLNSFKSVERAAEYEFKRQVELLERGEKVVQETRGWDDAKQKTTSQRSKEDAQDYRYMPDPDIPPIVLTEKEISVIQSEVGMLPEDFRNEFKTIGLNSAVTSALLSNVNHARLIVDAGQQSKEDAIRIANWFVSVFKIDDDETQNQEEHSISLNALLELSKMVNDSELSSTAAKEIFLAIVAGETNPRTIAEDRELLQNSNEDEMRAIVSEILTDPASKQAVDDIHAGNDKAIGYLVGQVMKRSAGKANPAMAQRYIREQLSE